MYKKVEEMNKEELAIYLVTNMVTDIPKYKLMEMSPKVLREMALKHKQKLVEKKGE